jgi:hypothetical protein
VEQAAFLMAVQRVVGGVEIEDDLARRHPVCFKEEVDEQALDRRPVMADPMVARGSDGRMLEPVQGALPASGAQSLRLAWSLPASVASTGSWRS